MSDYVQTVAQTIIDQLREGTAPFMQPWKPGPRFMPYNPNSGRDYRGMNAVWLMMLGQANAYGDARWMTYRQAQEVDGQVRKGEKGALIQYWKWSGEEPVFDENGKPVVGQDGKQVRETVRYERPRVMSSVVFNAAQIDGLVPAPDRPQPPEWERHERAERILSQSHASIIHQPGDRACYQLGPDRIILPETGQFASPDAYYATALHELGHWTGHPTRLNRDLAHPFGSEGYAREELRAEIASLMLGDQLGIGHDPGQHVAYVGSWIKALEEDPREIFRAASDADKIVQHVLGLELAQEQTVGVTVTMPVLIHETEAAMKPNSERLYLVVPYAEKDTAKALGARWDKDAKAWFAPAGVNWEAFARWTPAEQLVHRAPVGNDPRQEFTAALREAGLKLNGSAEMDGKIHRVQVEGDRGSDRSGAYVGYLDGHPAGYINNFKTGYKANWKSQQRAAVLGDVDRARLAAEAAERRQERERLRNEQYAITAENVAAHLANASPAPDSHPYLVRKGVLSYGVLVNEIGALFLPPNDSQGQRWSEKGDLLVPIRDMDGQLLTAQSISPDGQKHLARGGRLHGGFHLIGDIDSSEPVLVSEGYATAATLHNATGFPVLVALSSTNLQAVAEACRARYPDTLIFLAGDNDHVHEHELAQNGQPRGNPGRQAAEQAAQAVGGIVLLPNFKPGDPGTDWNDLASDKGNEEVARQFRLAFAVEQKRHHALSNAKALGPTLPNGLEKGHSEGVLEHVQSDFGR